MRANLGGNKTESQVLGALALLIESGLVYCALWVRRFLALSRLLSLRLIDICAGCGSCGCCDSFLLVYPDYSSDLRREPLRIPHQARVSHPRHCE